MVGGGLHQNANTCKQGGGLVMTVQTFTHLLFKLSVKVKI